MADSALISKQFDFGLLDRMLAVPKTPKALYTTIVNAPFKFQPEATLHYLGIIVFLNVNKKEGTIDRVALSDTELAKNTLKISVKKFEEIKIPLKNKENIIAKAVKTNQPQDTTDWRLLFTPELSAREARMNQASAGIGFSTVYPVNGSRSALIFSYHQYPREIGEKQNEFMSKYVEIVEKHLRRVMKK